MVKRSSSVNVEAERVGVESGVLVEHDAFGAEDESFTCDTTRSKLHLR